MASLPSRQKCKHDKCQNISHLFPLFLKKLTYEGWPKTTVTGWGTLREGAATLPEKLQKVKVKPINDAALGAGRIKDVMICAGQVKLKL